MNFGAKLDAAWKASNSLVCVGLDPEPKKFPDRFRDAEFQADCDAMLGDAPWPPRFGG